MKRILLALLLLTTTSQAAITQAALSTKLQTNLSAVLHAPVDSAQLKSVCDAIALAIVQEITSNAVVVPGTFSNSGGAVTGAGAIQ